MSGGLNRNDVCFHVTKDMYTKNSLKQRAMIMQSPGSAAKVRILLYSVLGGYTKSVFYEAFVLCGGSFFL